MSTFIEDQNNKSTVVQQHQQPEEVRSKPIAGIDPSTNQPLSNTPWTAYLNALNGVYQDKIKKAAQYSSYKFNLRYENGRKETFTFTRVKLLQWQFDEIEDLRAEATELSAANQPRKAQKTLTLMYKKAANYLLFNTKTEQMMTEDEYNHCEFSDVRPALDASMLLSLVSDPN